MELVFLFLIHIPRSNFLITSALSSLPEYIYHF